MRVRGREVPQSLMDALLSKMRSGVFSSTTLAGDAAMLMRKETARWPLWREAMRIAQRLIERERRAGRIKETASPDRIKRWVWVGTETRKAPGCEVGDA